MALIADGIDAVVLPLMPLMLLMGLCREYKRDIKDEGETSERVYGMGCVLLAMGHLTDALVQFNRSLELNPAGR
jgi:hypothetical protein